MAIIWQRLVLSEMVIFICYSSPPCSFLFHGSITRCYQEDAGSRQLWEILLCLGTCFLSFMCPLPPVNPAFQTHPLLFYLYHHKGWTWPWLSRLGDGGNFSSPGRLKRGPLEFKMQRTHSWLWCAARFKHAWLSRSLSRSMETPLKHTHTAWLLAPLQDTWASLYNVPLSQQTLRNPPHCTRTWF